MKQFRQTKARATTRQRLRKLLMMALICIIICVGGCIRIGQELTRPPLGSGYDKPENKFYMGSHEVIAASKFFGPFIILLPGELIVDTLFLPIDCLRYSYFKLNPPLAYYIEHDDLEGARKKLESGADPNKIDYRVIALEPVMIAKSNNKFASFKLLTDYGAKIPPDFFKYPTSMEFFRYVFDNHLLDGVDWKIPNKGLIFRWIPRYLDNNEQNELDKRIELIALLLEQGLSPNDLDDKDLKEHKTALDILLEADYNGLDKSKLIKLLKSHGAKTYQELMESQPELPTK